MYCTSTQVKVLRDSDFISFGQKGISKFPQPYVDFMKTYGIGTYGGAICIGTPDFDVLKDFAEYHFWKFKDAPITDAQFCECVVIGNSIDGDYIAIHSQELICKGWFLPPNTYDCGSFVVNGTAVVGKEKKSPYNRWKSTQKGANFYEISI